MDAKSHPIIRGKQRRWNGQLPRHLRTAILLSRSLCIADRTITAFAGRSGIFVRRPTLLQRQPEKRPTRIGTNNHVGRIMQRFRYRHRLVRARIVTGRTLLHFRKDFGRNLFDRTIVSQIVRRNPIRLSKVHPLGGLAGRAALVERLRLWPAILHYCTASLIS
jgi:hypothetical protein